MDATLAEYLAENGCEVTPRRPEGFGITAPEYAHQQGCSTDKARDLLEQAEAAGILGMHIMIVCKAVTRVYHRPAEWPPKCE